jgi:hypothetical protein
MQKLVANPLLLTGCLILTSVSHAHGQFNIKVPKLPKVVKEQPSRPSDPGQPTTTGNSGGTRSPSERSNPSAGQSSAVSGGVPIPGAKVFFSSTPFTNNSSGARSSFASNEFIYGRLELDRSISEAFGLGNLPNRDYYYIRYHVIIGDGQGSSLGPNSGNYLYLSKEDANRNFLNFDVLPDPNDLSTVLAVIDELWNYKFPAGLGGQIKQSARSIFPKNGDYPIQIVLFQSNFDDYGEPRFDGEPLPYAAGQFTFQFSAKDVAAITANYDKAVDQAETARNRSDTVKALPAWWGKTQAPADPKLSAARITALINAYANQWGRAYLGKFAWDSYSMPIWNVQKNDVGLPSYRYAPFVWAVYKDDKDGMCYFGSHQIREDYSGAGTYGQTYLSTMSNRTYIDCAAVR